MLTLPARFCCSVFSGTGQYSFVISSSFPPNLNPGQSADNESQLMRFGYSVSRSMPENCIWAFEPAFYNQVQFLNLKKEVAVWMFYLASAFDGKTRVEAVLNFVVSEGKAVSLSGAPSGGPDCSPNLPAEILELFLQHVFSELQANNITELEIRLPAMGISERSAEVNHLLRKQNFSIALSEVNHHLPANSGEFENRLHLSAKRRLKKLFNAGFEFRVEPLGAAEIIFRFIEACRLEKGFYLSLTFGQLQQAIKAAPDRYHFFSVSIHNEIAAATIGVLSTASVLYNYAPAHKAKFSAYSPVVLLTQGMVQWCQQNELQFLDLGTSTLNNQPNLPLIRFKEHLGGIPSEKLTLVKKF